MVWRAKMVACQNAAESCKMVRFTEVVTCCEAIACAAMVANGGEKVWLLAGGLCSDLVGRIPHWSVAGGSRRGCLRLSQDTGCFFAFVVAVLERDVHFRRFAS